MEVSGLQLLVLSRETVTQFLHGVAVDEGPSGLAISTNRVHNLAGVLVVLSTYCINVAIGLAAAVLSSVTVFSNLGAQRVEAVQHGSVLGIEAVAQTALDTTDAVLQVIEVEVLAQIRTSQSTIVAVAPTITAEAKHEQEEYDNPEPAALTVETIVVVVGSCTDVSKRIVIHNKLLSKIFINTCVAHHRSQPTARDLESVAPYSWLVVVADWTACLGGPYS
nr:MAG TPA: hypothetical protein [Caudoviricetes sp.]